MLIPEDATVPKNSRGCESYRPDLNQMHSLGRSLPQPRWCTAHTAQRQWEWDCRLMLQYLGETGSKIKTSSGWNKKPGGVKRSYLSGVEGGGGVGVKTWPPFTCELGWAGLTHP